MLTILAIAVLLSFASASIADEAPRDDAIVMPLRRLSTSEWTSLVAAEAGWLSVNLPEDVRAWFRNPDGSCVQCSIGMCGVDQNCPEASTLLWDTEYGPRVRGGSDPSRVANYSRKRGIRLWNVTGDPTIDYMKWACRNGRGAAIGAGYAHFQTLMGHNPATDQWAVCNNNSPTKIDIYSDAGFRRLHLQSGRWCVVLDYPAHPTSPRYVRWW